MLICMVSSKSVSTFEKFPYKILFTESDENGLWGLKNNKCKHISFENTKNYVGKDHLYINWDFHQNVIMLQ